LFSLLGNNSQNKSCEIWWKKTKQLYVLPTLVDCYYVTSLDLWMPKGAYDILPLVLIFWG
jgi:hypothetical protein